MSLIKQLSFEIESIMYDLKNNEKSGSTEDLYKLAKLLEIIISSLPESEISNIIR